MQFLETVDIIKYSRYFDFNISKINIYQNAIDCKISVLQICFGTVGRKWSKYEACGEHADGKHDGKLCRRAGPQ